MNNFVTYEYIKIIPSNLKNNIILMIGRGHDKLKRLELGIMSMEYIKDEFPDSKMIIISNISNNNYIPNLVKDLNLKNKIKFTGYSSTPEIFYQNCSLHIFPTISESFGLVLSEAKIYGIPTILVGLDYVLISKGGTIIIYNDYPEYIAKRAIEILRNEDYRINLGKEARLSMKKFKNENLLNRWIELILAINKGYHFYNSLRKRGKKISKLCALKILMNQINLLKKKEKIYKNININNFENFDFGIK